MIKQLIGPQLKKPTPAQVLELWLRHAETNWHGYAKELPDGTRKWSPLVELTRAALAKPGKNP
jgi:hypothetical protein